MDKETCRLEMKELLTSMSGSKFNTKSRCLSLNLSNYLQNFDLNSVYIGVFSPIQKEPKWFLELLNLKHVKFGMVNIERDGSLAFYSMDIDKISNGVGLELSEDQKKIRVLPDLILIPGLAFSKGLERLGRGKGYFDKFLVNFKGEKIGICFGMQVLEKLETNNLDIKMNTIITDKNIYKERIIK